MTGIKIALGLVGFAACAVLIVLFALHEYEPSRLFVYVLIAYLGLSGLIFVFSD